MDKWTMDQRLRFHNLGQSLVETALFLPLLLFILAGALEVSNILITQNRVQTAARAGTGFGATNFNRSSPQAIQDSLLAMSNVALNNVEGTLELDVDRWDIYTIKATVNSTGNGYAAEPESEEYPYYPWDVSRHTHGIGEVFSDAEWTANEQRIAIDVMCALLSVEPADCEEIEDLEDFAELPENPTYAGREFISTIAYHNRESFLGLGYFNPGLTRIRGLTVMRLEELQGNYGGCDTFPIGMSLENYSVYPYDPNDPAGDALPTGREMYPFRDNVSPGTYRGNGYYWPNHGDEPPPSYNVSDMSKFPANVPGVHITSARPGYLYLVKQGGIEQAEMSGAFGWLRWKDSPSANNAPTLASSLKWPGNSTDYDYEPWSLDGVINKYDIVKVSTGARPTNDVTTWMREHVDEGRFGRQLRIIVFTPPSYNGGDANGDGHGTLLDGSSGQATSYEVFAFARVRFVGWYLPGQHNWLLVEFHGWDEECTVPPAG